jgi:hypothetical protein
MNDAMRLVSSRDCSRVASSFRQLEIALTRISRSNGEREILDALFDTRET